MNYNHLESRIRQKKSFLCVGLDTDIEKVPAFLKHHERPVLQFNKQIIEATFPYAVSYKLNTAFYESRGIEGWQDLADTVRYLKDDHPDSFVIADAKRGDIGNTSMMYAKAFFEKMDVDAVTVAPYMGEDSVKPFLGFDDKWVILLGLTSNKGAVDFQYFEANNGFKLYQQVIDKSREWGDCKNMMYVVGATRPEQLADIRKLVPDHFLLVPGIGAQGGDLAKVVQYGMNKHIGLLVNASRSIIFAGDGEGFADQAGQAAKVLQSQMSEFVY